MPFKTESAKDAGFAARVLDWFDRFGRHDLPWQHPREPYRVWLSEIMLQQTQVQTVIPYFERFLTALPRLTDLADAEPDQVISLWAGLGYYARARNLHRTAKLCVLEHGGQLPDTFDELHALPGIGRSTAGAILAQAHGRRYAILDGNVRRTLARYHGVDGWTGSATVQTRLWELAELHLPQARLADYTQAIMDLGATICRPRRPTCPACPLQETCVAFAQGRVAQLPQPRPAKKLPERSVTMLVLRDAADRVLLLRRPPTGVWSGMWSLPEASNDDEALKLLGVHTRMLEHDAHQPLTRIKHDFSHYRLHIEPRQWCNVLPALRIGDTSDYRWQALADLEATGLPAPVLKLLLGLRTAPQGKIT